MKKIKQQFRLLVVDDEASLREFLAIMLEREGYKVEAAESAHQALERLNHNLFDLIISDVQMPGMTGIELLDLVKEKSPETIVVMMTAFSSTEDAVGAMKKGAYDYIVKPFDNDELRLIVKNALERKTLRQENTRLKKALEKQRSFSGLIGQSKEIQFVYGLIDKVADSSVSVLITGESGTGKEVVARAIHSNSSRKDHPFIAVNCGAIPENLLESELFGHERGAFTGADCQKIGLIEEANGGTLFLDEIGELPQMMQVKLLRVLQDREVRRVGGTRNIKFNVRILAATNKNLNDEVQSGRFREDLYYRLNVIQIHLPPLRERREDIPQLIEHFCSLHGMDHVAIESSVLSCLLDYDWPGNVRELNNVVERCLVLRHSETIGMESLPQEVRRKPRLLSRSVELPSGFFDLDAYLQSVEKEIVLAALAEAGGVRKKAAERLGMSFRSIRYRLAKFGMDDETSGDN